MRLEHLVAERALSLHVADDSAQLAVAVAERIADTLRQAISVSGAASLALSGGRSPEAYLRLLDQQALDWQRVTLTLVDERWVPASHPDSNVGLLRRCMPRVMEQVNWLPLYRGDSPQADAAEADAHLKALPALSLCVLGMGVDGHCASLFPGLPGLATLLSDQAEQHCAAVFPVGQSPRLTLTGAALHSADLQLLVICGEDKYQRLCQAFAAAPEQVPVSAFLQPPLAIYYSPRG